MGEAVFSGWQNRNENRNFPLHDRATKLSVSGVKLPDTILADAHIALPQSAGRFVLVSSVGVSEYLVSLTFLATEGDPISGGALGAFIPMGVMTVQKPVIPYRNYPISPTYPGFGGWVAFGNGVAETDNLALQFIDPKATVLASKIVRSYKDIPVQSLGRLGSDLALTGLVHLQGQPGLIRIRKVVRTIDGVNKEVLVLGLDLDNAADPTALLLSFAGPCGRPEQRTCPPGKAILTINGVSPDCAGNIRIRIVGLDATIVGVDAIDTLGNLVASGNIVDMPVGLDDVCAALNPTRFDPTDICLPSSSSSSSDSSESSPSSSSVSSSSPSPSPEEYCEDFEGASPFDVLIPKQGDWRVATVAHLGETSQRLISERGHFGPQVIIHDSLYKATDPSIPSGYDVEATIRPITEIGNGHVIFAYKSLDDFWFAGFSLNAVSDVSGLLYVGRKSADRTTALDNWPSGLNYGYFFARAFPPSADPGAVGPGGGAPVSDDGLFSTDIRVTVTVEPIALGSSINLVKVSYAWNDDRSLGIPAAPPFASFIFTVSPSDSDLRGYCGLGVVGSETEFDDFGIDCPVWPSSSSSSSA